MSLRARSLVVPDRKLLKGGKSGSSTAGVTVLDTHLTVGKCLFSKKMSCLELSLWFSAVIWLSLVEKVM